MISDAVSQIVIRPVARAAWDYLHGQHPPHADAIVPSTPRQPSLQRKVYVHAIWAAAVVLLALMPHIRFPGLWESRDTECMVVRGCKVKGGTLVSCHGYSNIRLDLSSSCITRIQSGAFDSLTNLTMLDLSSNQLASLPPGIFDNLTSLIQLYLHSNQLTTLPPGIFDSLMSLTELDLNSNQLATFPPGIFDSLTSLSWLGLSSNQLTRLPPGIFDSLTSLTAQDLSNNQLTSLPPGTFDNVTTLTTLTLDGNQLTRFPPGTFDSLTRLATLVLDEAPSTCPAWCTPASRLGANWCELLEENGVSAAWLAGVATMFGIGFIAGVLFQICFPSLLPVQGRTSSLTRSSEAAPVEHTTVRPNKPQLGRHTSGMTRVYSDAAEAGSAACDNMIGDYQAGVKAAVEAVCKGGDKSVLTKACEARDAYVAAVILQCKQVLAWARAASVSDDDRSVEAWRQTIERWKKWQAALLTVKGAMRRVEKAVNDIEEMKKSHHSMELAFVKAQHQFDDGAMAGAEYKKVKARWDTTHSKMAEAKATLRDAREWLCGLQEEYPEVEVMLTKQEGPENLRLLHKSGMLRSRKLTDDYETLKKTTPGTHTVRHVVYKGDGTQKALKAVPVGEVKTIQREVAIPCRIHHQNIMPVELAFIEDDMLYVQTQWCPEGDLGRWLRAERRSVREVASMACGVLHGLVYLHCEGVIHGDIKPGNILISDDLQPRISDWGTCRRTREGSVTNEASTRGFTEGYAAPELLKGGRATRASDTFAMGKVLQWLLDNMAEPDAADDVALALQQEMQRLANECCKEEATCRPTSAQVQESSLYRQPLAQQAMGSDIVVQSLARYSRHFTWEVQQPDGSWQQLDDVATKVVEMKYQQYVAAGDRLAQQHEAEEGENESEGKDESKGDDGGPTGYNGSLSFATLEGGGIIVFRSMAYCEPGSDAAARVRRHQTAVYPFPERWDHFGGDCKLVPLRREDEEFKAVEAVLSGDVHAEGSDMRLAAEESRCEAGEDMSGAVVESVVRVQNKCLWERYCHHKWHMEHRERGGGPNELWLWHGSYDTSPEILCRGYDGIDFRRSGDGNLYGRGAYFAEQPRYSNTGYAYDEGGFKHVILARVLCGTAKEMGTNIDRSIKVPPEGYDSIRGGPHYPRADVSEQNCSHMRVVYDNACVYPAYIVKYRHQ